MIRSKRGKSDSATASAVASAASATVSAAVAVVAAGRRRFFVSFRAILIFGLAFYQLILRPFDNCLTF